MQKRIRGRYLLPLLIAVVFSIGSAGTVLAVGSSSPNYQVTETQFTASPTLNSCSGQYCAQTSIGDPVAGQSAAAQKTAAFGSIIDSEPLLEVIVEAGPSNLGILTSETTSTKTTTVKIRNYLSWGYILQIIGDAPKFQDHTLATSSTPVVSEIGTEQFGINAVANTVPAVGANAIQVPSDQTSFGFITDSYKTANKFMFLSGDVVARSASSSGQTEYTISMVVNISSGTPAGRYAADFSAVVIPVY
jgi:hypothetical protein